MNSNFNISEFKCKCCGRVFICERLIQSLEVLRFVLGDVPIKITPNGGYRCAERNEEIGGAKDSMHMRGIAADIIVNGVSPMAVGIAAKNVPEFMYGGIGIYKSFTHLDVRGLYGFKKARWGW